MRLLLFCSISHLDFNVSVIPRNQHQHAIIDAFLPDLEGIEEFAEEALEEADPLASGSSPPSCTAVMPFQRIDHAVDPGLGDWVEDVSRIRHPVAVAQAWIAHILHGEVKISAWQ